MLAHISPDAARQLRDFVDAKGTGNYGSGSKALDQAEGAGKHADRRPSGLRTHGGAASTPDSWAAVPEVETHRSSTFFDPAKGTWQCFTPGHGYSDCAN